MLDVFMVGGGLCLRFWFRGQNRSTNTNGASATAQERGEEEGVRAEGGSSTS